MVPTQSDLLICDSGWLILLWDFPVMTGNRVEMTKTLYGLRPLINTHSLETLAQSENATSTFHASGSSSDSWLADAGCAISALRLAETWL